MFNKVIDIIFGCGLFFNAILFIPQAITLIKEKKSTELSLVTFIGFCLFQFVAILYGIIHNDYILIIGFFLSLLTCGLVTFLIIYYKIKSKNYVIEKA